MDLLAEKHKLIGRTFRHFKMRLSPTAVRLADERDAPAAQRSGRVSA